MIALEANSLLPVMVNSAGKSVSGVVYTVQSMEQEMLLHEYEGRMYRAKHCWIHIGDDKVIGKVFAFRGKRRDLE